MTPYALWEQLVAKLLWRTGCVALPSGPPHACVSPDTCLGCAYAVEAQAGAPLCLYMAHA